MTRAHLSENKTKFKALEHMREDLEREEGLEKSIKLMEKMAQYLDVIKIRDGMAKLKSEKGRLEKVRILFI